VPAATWSAPPFCGGGYGRNRQSQCCDDGWNPPLQPQRSGSGCLWHVFARLPTAFPHLSCL